VVGEGLRRARARGNGVAGWAELGEEGEGNDIMFIHIYISPLKMEFVFFGGEG
jgi:hypothetical protein